MVVRTQGKNSTNADYAVHVTRMTHGNLHKFDPIKESIEDFRKRFEFYCLANNICDNNEENLQRKTTLSITHLGQTMF